MSNQLTDDSDACRCENHCFRMMGATGEVSAGGWGRVGCRAGTRIQVKQTPKPTCCLLLHADFHVLTDMEELAIGGSIT